MLHHWSQFNVNCSEKKKKERTQEIGAITTTTDAAAVTQIELRLNNGLIRDCCWVSIILIINSIAGAFITTRAGLSIYIIFPIAFAAMPKLFYCAACCISLCILVIFCCAVCMCILCNGRVIYCFIFSLASEDKEKKRIWRKKLEVVICKSP